MGFYFSKDKSKEKVSFPIKRKTLDRLFMVTGGLAVLDFILGAAISHFTSGELKTLHEYLGMPPQMNETAIGIGMIYGLSSVLYAGFLRKRFLGKRD